MRAIAALLFLGLVGAADAQTSSPTNYPGPMPAVLPPAIPAPLDIAYPAGILQLSVDATDTARGIMRMHEVIPVAKPGRLTLLYPKWLPGNHSPVGPIDKLSGLVIHAGNRVIPWVRDTVDVYAFHVEVPEGASSVTADFQFLSPVESKEGRVVFTDVMLDLQWNAVVLYPAGYFARRIPVSAELKLPAGWQMGTALEAGEGGRFKTVPLETLVDSPVLAGRHFTHIDLDPATHVRLAVAADRPAQLKTTEAEIAPHRALIQQAYRLYGSHHYDHYDFLLGLSDHVTGEGLEHHRSSEDITTAKYFSQWDKSSSGRDLLAHEYTHSWNGKFRRPADLWTPNYNVPMGGSLLWVYEGQTQFWGFVLAARSGLWTKQQALDAFADNAAYYGTLAGRQWRPLADTTNDPIIAHRAPIPWRSYQRSEDYYNEGLLLWLDADSLVRERTKGQKSLDDFARTFFGIDDGSFVPVTYTFDDVVKGLNSVLPYDWAGFLKTRLALAVNPPLDGVTRGGYRLTYSEMQSERNKTDDARRKRDNFSFSLGLILDNKGMVTDVAWDGPAFNAGITIGSQVMAVNGVDYDGEEMRDAITEAKTAKEPITLLVKRDGAWRTLNIAYHGGLRYPHLERVEGQPALLDQLLAARK